MLAEVVGACAGGAVFTGWALYLGCSPLLIGVLGALGFFAQFIQFPAAWLSARVGYRRLTILAVSLSRQLLLPLAALPWLPIPAATKQGLLLGVAALSALLGVVGNNAWTAWMGELVPRRIRGRYFGRRSALCALGSTSAALCAGVLLDRARPLGLTGHVLSALALVACATGALTTVLLCRQHDPSPRGGREPLDLSASLLPLSDTRGRRVLAYQLVWSGAVGLSSTLLSLHMLQNLRMGFTLVALYNAGLAGVRMLSAPHWGRAVDRVGARTVLTFCSFGMALVPVLWLFPRAGALWPLLIDVLLSGVLTSGHALASFTLPLSVAPREGRPFYLAAFATAAGLAYSAAAVLGGWLATHAPAELHLGGLSLFGLHLVFLLSALGRLLAALLGLRIREAASRPLPELVGLVVDGATALPLRLARLSGHIARSPFGAMGPPLGPFPRQAGLPGWPLRLRRSSGAVEVRPGSDIPSCDPVTAARTGAAPSPGSPRSRPRA